MFGGLRRNPGRGIPNAFKTAKHVGDFPAGPETVLFPPFFAFFQLRSPGYSPSKTQKPAKKALVFGSGGEIPNMLLAALNKKELESRGPVYRTCWQSVQQRSSPKGKFEKHRATDHNSILPNWTCLKAPDTEQERIKLWEATRAKRRKVQSGEGCFWETTTSGGFRC